MVLFLYPRGQRTEVQLDTLYYMWKNHEKDRDVILAGFVKQNS